MARSMAESDLDAISSNCQKSSEASWRARAALIEFAGEIRQRFAALGQLAQDVARAHGGVLHVGSGVAFEAERFLKIESDHGIARELQHEVAQRADGDLGGNLPALVGGRFGMPRVHFFQRLFDQLVDQIVGLDAQALAARDLDVGRFLSSSESSMPSSTQVPGESATIS